MDEQKELPKKENNRDSNRFFCGLLSLLILFIICLFE